MEQFFTTHDYERNESKCYYPYHRKEEDYPDVEYTIQKYNLFFKKELVLENASRYVILNYLVNKVGCKSDEATKSISSMLKGSKPSSDKFSCLTHYSMDFSSLEHKTIKYSSEAYEQSKASWKKKEEERLSKRLVEFEQILKNKAQKRQSKTVLNNLKLFEQVPEEFRSNLTYGDEGEIRKMEAVLILDIGMNIVDVVKSKQALQHWVVEQGLQKTAVSRQTVYSYIKEKRLYCDKYFFVPLKNYKEFLK